MGYVFGFVFPFVLGYFLGVSLGARRTVLVNLFLIVGSIILQHQSSVGNLGASTTQWVEGWSLAEPYAIILMGPIYLMGLLLGCGSNASKKSINAKLETGELTNQGAPLTTIAPPLPAPFLKGAGTTRSATESLLLIFKGSPLTASIVVLTLIAIPLGLFYDWRNDSLGSNVRQYVLDNKQIIARTGGLNNDIHPTVILGQTPQLTRQHSVYVYPVHGEKGNFTVLINVDGSALSPEFSLNSIHAGVMSQEELIEFNKADWLAHNPHIELPKPAR